MKAFVAVLLVAAVSGQFTGHGAEQGLWGMLRNRVGYTNNGVGGAYGYPTGTYGRYIQQAIAGLVGNEYDSTYAGYPYGQQYNVPSDVYTPGTYQTLSQLYASPVFQQYLNLPFFRAYITYPAFQRYLATGYFQQYYTQPIFQQFFREPALFYKYIYPVVAQFQNFGTYEPVITVPEAYRQYVPEYVYNYVNRVVDTGVVGPKTVYPGYGYNYPTTQGNNGIYNGVFGNGIYNREYTPYNKFGGFGGFGGFNWEKLAAAYGRNYPYGYNWENNWNVNDIETIRRGLFPQNWEKYTTQYPKTWGNTFGGKKYTTGVETTGTYYPQFALEKVLKDLVEGRVELGDFVKTAMVQDSVKNTVVDPVTGEFKTVEEKVVKPIGGNTFEGKLAKDALHKIMLEKEVFNKV